MASLSVSASTNSLYLSFSGLDHPVGNYEQFAFKVGNLTINTTSNGVSFDRYDTSLYIQCGTSYTCSGAAKYNGTWYTINSGTSYSTLACPVYPSSPTIGAVSSTTTTITTPVTFGANTHHVNVYILQATTPTLTLYSSGSVTHQGLTANTEYTVYYQAWDSSKSYGSGSANFKKFTAGARPANFSGWGITVAAGQPATITAAKWLEFQSKINDFRVYKGKPLYSFSGATYVYTGATLYAWLANQLRSAIYDINTSVPAAVAADDAITAAWLNGLTNALNGVT